MLMLFASNSVHLHNVPHYCRYLFRSCHGHIVLFIGPGSNHDLSSEHTNAIWLCKLFPLLTPCGENLREPCNVAKVNSESWIADSQLISI